MQHETDPHKVQMQYCKNGIEIMSIGFFWTSLLSINDIRNNEWVINNRAFIPPLMKWKIGNIMVNIIF